MVQLWELAIRNNFEELNTFFFFIYIYMEAHGSCNIARGKIHSSVSQATVWSTNKEPVTPLISTKWK